MIRLKICLSRKPRFTQTMDYLYSAVGLPRHFPLFRCRSARHFRLFRCRSAAAFPFIPLSVCRGISLYSAVGLRGISLYSAVGLPRHFPLFRCRSAAAFPLKQSFPAGAVEPHLILTDGGSHDSIVPICTFCTKLTEQLGEE